MAADHILSLAELDALYHERRAEFAEPLRLRLHRAVSWLKKAAALDDDLDLKFITLWIAFNALYGRQINLSGEDRPAELQGGDRCGFKRFLSLICAADEKQLIYHALWGSFSQSIRVLLMNRYTYQTFWNYQRGLISEHEAAGLWEENQRLVHSALSHQNSGLLTGLIFDRLYTVRNQLVHGAATYGSSINRAQLRDGCRILSLILPGLTQICIEQAGHFDLGDPLYPVVSD